jgi:hypothetical protein
MEDTMAGLGARDHRGRIVRQLVVDNQASATVMREACGRKAALAQSFVEAPIDREFDRHIPIGGATGTRVTTPVVCVNAQGTNARHRGSE